MAWSIIHKNRSYANFHKVFNPIKIAPGLLIYVRLQFYAPTQFISNNWNPTDYSKWCTSISGRSAMLKYVHCGTTPSGTAANAQIKKNRKLGAGRRRRNLSHSGCWQKKREWIDFFPLKHSQAINLTAGFVPCAALLFFQIPTRGERERVQRTTRTSILTLARPLRLMQIEAS